MARPTRYRDLEAPSLVNVAARSTRTGAPDLAGQLADTFATFSRAASDVGAQLSADLGQRQGAEEGLAGKPNMRSSLTAFGRAYNDAALRGYAIRAEQDANETATRLEVEAGTDPEKFRLAMDEVRRATLSEAPPETKALVEEVYLRRTGQGVARINAALATELKEEDRTLVADEIAQKAERISFLKTQDTDESFLEAQEEEVKLGLLIDGAVSTGAFSKTEGEALRRAASRDVIFNTVMQRFKNELADPAGDPVSMIEAVKEIVRQDQSLTPEQEAALENSLLAELRDFNALRSMRESQADAAREARYRAGDQEATTQLLAGTLTRRALLQMVEEDRLQPSTARTLLNELESPVRAPKSDPEELFFVETNLLYLSEEDIATNQQLTWGDRADLINKRREEAESWKGTQTAREAFDRIDRALGIIPGTNPRLLSEEEIRARDEALTELYDAVDALPPEQRQVSIMPMTQEVIQNRIRSQARDRVAQLRESLANYKATAGDPAEMRGDRLRTYQEDVARLERLIAEEENKAR